MTKWKFLKDEINKRWASEDEIRIDLINYPDIVYFCRGGVVLPYPGHIVEDAVVESDSGFELNEDGRSLVSEIPRKMEVKLGESYL